MAIRRIIPDSYTDYEDGHLGVVPASLANVEAKIGPAEGGQPNKVYTLSGPDAKKQAKTIFKGGPLLHALEEAFDAGSTRAAGAVGSLPRVSARPFRCGPRRIRRDAACLQRKPHL